MTDEVKKTGEMSGQMAGHPEHIEDTKPQSEQKAQPEQKDWKKLYDEAGAQIKSLSAEAEKAKNEIKDLTEEAARARADYYNLRTRVERNRERDSKLAAEKSVNELLPIFENLERICGSLEDKSGNLFRGVSMVTKQFSETMQHLGLEQIPTEGKFDPALHEAVSLEHVDDKEKDGMIVGALRKGYKLAGRVIRAPQVRVGKYVGKE